MNRTSETDTLAGRLRELAKLKPNAIAVSYRGKSISYADLTWLVRRSAARIGSMGVKAGDVVVVSGVSEPEALVCYVAAQAAGCVSAFSYHRATSGSLAAACELANARLLVTDSLPSGFDPPCPVVSLKGIIAEPGEAGDGDSGDPRPSWESEEAPTEILFTTGTTGTPKAVLPHPVSPP